MVYEILKCQDDLKEDDDPACADISDINDWLSTKQLHLKVVDNKIDFNSYEEMAVR